VAEPGWRTRWWAARAVLNLVNLSTPLGLAVGAVGRARFRRGPRGLVLGSGLRLPVPARAITFGDVVLSPLPATYLDQRPALLAHEERHAWQYVACLGLPMLPLYLLASAWSYVRGGDVAVHNLFERAAGLEDGGYPTVSARERRRRSSEPERRRPALAEAP
jgi:hypothetical protein